jgi:hypothetical protein
MCIKAYETEIGGQGPVRAVELLGREQQLTIKLILKCVMFGLFTSHNMFRSAEIIRWSINTYLSLMTLAELLCIIRYELVDIYTVYIEDPASSNTTHKVYI